MTPPPATPAQRAFLTLATHARIHDHLDRIETVLESQEREALWRDAVDLATLKQRIIDIKF